MLERNEALRASVLGPEIALDATQSWVLGYYQRVRRRSPEGSLAIPDDCDPMLERHLWAIDDEYAKSQHEAMEEARASAMPTPPHGVSARRH